MDALILSCGTGGGHNSVGRAVREELEARGHRAKLLNPYTLRSKRLARGIDRAYVGLAQKAPRVFGAVYQAGQLYRQLPVHSPVYLANKAMRLVMEEYLEREPADIVIMPHLFPAEIFTNMARRGVSTPRTLFIATDYACIPFTEETECDGYVIPAGELAGDFTSRGLPADRLYPLGIPVERKYRREETRQEARRRLGLEPDKPYILMAGGSMGGGSIERAVRALDEELARRDGVGLIVVCGDNDALYDHLAANAGPEVILLRYTQELAGYLRAADLFITKPGGLSSTEAAVRGVPIVHTCAIPGCETKNAAYFQRLGMSRTCDVREVVRTALELLEDEEAQRAMIAAQRRHIDPAAAERICDLAERMVARGWRCQPEH